MLLNRRQLALSAPAATAARPSGHAPKLAGGTGILRAGTAYCLVYMRTLLKPVNHGLARNAD